MYLSTCLALVAEYRRRDVQQPLILNDIFINFDRLGRAATELFSQKARIVAILVGIAMAFVANIDAARLLKQLLDNPELRSAMIEQVDQANADNQAALASLEVMQRKLNSLDYVEPNSSVTVDPDALKQTVGDLRNELSKAEAKVRDSLSELKGQGLAFGWDHFPYCKNGTSALCNAQSTDAGAGFFEYVSWFLMVFLAGTLIGLGGPFWFKVFTRLSSVLTTLRSLGFGKTKTAAKTDAQEQNGSTPAERQSPSPLEEAASAFRRSVALHALTPKTNRRVLLGPDGAPLNESL